MQDDAGVYRSLPRERGPAGATRATAYADGTTAALALYSGRLAWRVTYRAASDAVYDVLVDAENGKVLRRANLVKSATPAKVWENHPGRGAGRGGGTVDLEQDGWLAAGATRLFGPNVHAFADVADDDTLVPADEIARRSRSTGWPSRRPPASGCTAAKPCSWDPTVANSWQTNQRQNAVQAFYLANRFHDHLAAAPISFTTAASRAATGCCCTPTTAPRPARARTATTSTTRTCSRRPTARRR